MLSGPDLSILFGPGLLSGKWVAPEHLPGDIGGETQKADIRQVACPKKTVYSNFAWGCRGATQNADP